jgi:hypothetical protein
MIALVQRVFLLAAVFACTPTPAEEVLLRQGAHSHWSYLDAGAIAGSKWAMPDPGAARWKSGPAPLGYGRPGMGTTVSYGSDANAKPITTYFRRFVDIADPGAIETLVLDLRRDDGAIVYWNGVEIVRSNMPGGTVTPRTTAVDTISGDMELEFRRHVIGAKTVTLARGRNVLAVEIHQASASSSDIVFDLALTAYGRGEQPTTDTYADAFAALRAGDNDKALPLLLAMPASRAGAAQLLLHAAHALTPTNAAPDARDRALLDAARRAAPDDMDIVSAWIRARVDARTDLPIKPLARTAPPVIAERFRFIADTPDGARPGPILSRARLLADVDDLELLLENCYSYLERLGADYRGALDALRASLVADTPREVFAHRVARVLSIFGDPHSRLRDPVGGARRAALLFAEVDQRLVALRPDRTGFIDAAHPYVTHINGRPAREWIEAAEQVVPQASPQYRRHLALIQLRKLPLVARQLKLPADGFTLTLASRDGRDQTPHRVALDSGGGASVPRWADARSGIRADNIGYLRIAAMEDGAAFIASLERSMRDFAGTRGLIIDVRGNGGGTQDAIRTILPWLMQPGSPMKIINVAAYRLPLALPEPNRSGFLGMNERGLHPATSAFWTPEQAGQIRAFLATWSPRWNLPAGKFGDWHVMAIAPHPAGVYYGKPVIVLQDEEDFSATDNFLGALKGHPGVTLMGSPSGGGSGRMAEYTLPNSHITLTLCQMASFTSTGQTYDGNGILPDVTLAPRLDDILIGGGDAVLDAAVARLLK